MIIRPARLQDYADFTRLYLEVNDLHAAAHPGLFRGTRQPPQDETDFLLQLEDPTQAIFMAEEEEQAAGFINVLLRETPPIEILVPRRFAVVDAVGVSRRFRRRGIGQALMARAEQWALQHGASSVELTVWEFNRDALVFYAELGFESMSRRLHKKLS